MKLYDIVDDTPEPPPRMRSIWFRPGVAERSGEGQFEFRRAFGASRIELAVTDYKGQPIHVRYGRIDEMIEALEELRDFEPEG